MTPPDRDAEKDAIRQDAHDWWSRLDDEDATDADHAAFEDWLAADPRRGEAFDQVEQLWAALGSVDAAEVRARLPDRDEQNGIVTTIAPRPRWRDRPWVPRAIAGAATASIAAAVAVAVLPIPALFDRTPVATIDDYATARGQIEEIALADGSTLTLGAMSAVEVTLAHNARAVTLKSGEAFFDVASDADRPFTVSAGDMKVVVTGTAFDVRLGETRTDVAVSEGAVSVSYPIMVGGVEHANMRTRRQVTVGLSIAATRDRGLRPPQEISGDAVAAWRTGQLSYAGMPLADVVADANRYSETPIRIDDAVRDIKVWGTFRAADIDETLDILADIFPIRIDRSAGDAIRIVPTDG
ncbi:MAG: FecR domain-containing protein [Pseudomonadota bacterium]